MTLLIIHSCHDKKGPRWLRRRGRGRYAAVINAGIMRTIMENLCTRVTDIQPPSSMPPSPTRSFPRNYATAQKSLRTLWIIPRQDVKARSSVIFIIIGLITGGKSLDSSAFADELKRKPSIENTFQKYYILPLLNFKRYKLYSYETRWKEKGEQQLELKLKSGENSGLGFRASRQRVANLTLVRGEGGGEGGAVDSVPERKRSHGWQRPIPSKPILSSSSRVR